MSCNEHVVCLDGGADEEARKRENGETEAFCQIGVCEGLCMLLACCLHTLLGEDRTA